MNKFEIKKIAEEILKSPKITPEMRNWFNKRTKYHIDLVRKYCERIRKLKKRYNGILERGKRHDNSKFINPEYIPYIYISWQYKCKDDKVDFQIPKFLNDQMNEATEHHVKNNPHHPEYYCDDVETINREDRDKPNKLIDCTKMPTLSICEMVADWCAMSEEKGGNPKDWADKNVGIRWKFNNNQIKLIYDLISKIWS